MVERWPGVSGGRGGRVLIAILLHYTSMFQFNMVIILQRPKTETISFSE